MRFGAETDAVFKLELRLLLRRLVEFAVFLFSTGSVENLSF